MITSNLLVSLQFSDKPTEPYAAKCVWFEGEKVQHGTYSLEAIELWKDID